MDLLLSLNLKAKKIKFIDINFLNMRLIKISNQNNKELYYNNFHKKYYFTIKNDTLILTKSIKKLIPYCDRVEIKKSTIELYKDTGLIIPPFTYLENIYCLPIFSRIIFKNSGLLKIKFDGKPRGYKKPFANQDDFELEISGITKRLIKSNVNKKICTTISGGMDSSYLLSLIRESNSKIKIDSLCCHMDFFEKESLKAKSIAQQCKADFFYFVPKKINIDNSLESFINTECELVYDSVVPLISVMMNYYKKKINTKEKILVFEGQGADTNLIGLPHNLAIEIYNKRFSKLFKILGNILPKNLEDIRLKKRKLYRIYKMILILGEASWMDAFLVSLGFQKNKYLVEYQYYKKVLIVLEENLNCKHKAIMSFFQLILQVREMQKYKVFPKNFYVALPFMDLSLIKRCFNSKTNFFFTIKNRKIPLVKAVTKRFPNMFEKNKTTPFIVRYEKNDKSNKLQRSFLSDREIREKCIVLMNKKITKWKSNGS